MEKYDISENAETNTLINNIVHDLKKFSDSLVNNLNKLTDIGIALSSELHTPKLLEMIVDLSRDLTNADGGTLYIVSPDRKQLMFEIIQTDSLNIKMGGTFGKITWPPVQLYKDSGEENHSNVSAHVALTGELVNIPDVYDADGFDFSGTKEFDKKTHYRSKSMLVLPLRDHEKSIIGVLQLLNASNVLDSSIMPFSKEAQTMTLSLASQAAVTLTKNRLLLDLENLFESFIRTIAKAIDRKSPYTGGHVRRVADISMMIVEEICKKDSGPFAKIDFTEEQKKELYLSAWLHDIGKITTPEYIVDKGTKLETIFDRIDVIKSRFELFKRNCEVSFLKKKVELLENNKKDEIKKLEKEYIEKIESIDSDIKFLVEVNTGGEFLSDDKTQRIKEIGRNVWEIDGETKTWLSDDEIANLSIKKGTLLDEERDRIQDHVRVTEDMLKELPFPKRLSHVTEYACAHHETLNGKGYHKGLKGDQITLQSRILAIADIFEALSASDRPYKKGKTASEVVKILGFMAKDQHIDSDLFDLFINQKLFHKYIKAEYKPDQIDIDLDT